MRITSRAFLIGCGLALAGSSAFAQKMPAVPGVQEGVKAPSGGQDLSTAAKEALNNVKSARSNINKKDYTSAKTDISNARTNLKNAESSSGLGQAMDSAGAKTGASPLTKVDKNLNAAEQALGQNQPKAADSLLKKVEGPLQSITG